MPDSLVSKLWSLFTLQERKQAGVLLLLMLVGTSLEVIGVGLIFPVVALLAAPDQMSELPLMAWFQGQVGPTTQNVFIAEVLVCLVGVFVVKNGFLGFLAYWQSRFIFNKQAALSVRLFDGYLAQPYTFHLQRNSAELIRNLTLDSERLTIHVLAPGIALIAESLVGIGLVILLIAVSKYAALIVVGLLGGTTFLIFRFVRHRLNAWGERLHYHDGQRIQHLQQGLGAIKDVKVAGREAFFAARFTQHAFARARFAGLQFMFSLFPLLWLEILAVAGVLGIVAIMMFQGQPLAVILPTLGMFTAATFRLMPTANRILVAVQNLKFCAAVIDTLHAEMHEIAASSRTGQANGSSTPDSGLNRPLIELAHVCYRYPGTPGDTLHDISFTLPAGSTIGLIGASGCGKTTLLDVILGLLPPTSGSVLVEGKSIYPDPGAWQRQIGYIPQSIYLTDDSIRRNVAFGLPDDEIADEQVWQALEMAQLREYVQNLPEGLDTRVGERGVRLSGGQRQRIGIARALYHAPAILVLDEATSALDNATEDEFMKAIYALRASRTIIIVAHRLSTVQYCDRILTLDDGRVVTSQVQDERGAPPVP
jgi:ABC-type multidrug transport system fused ATPase/permease subunit